MMYLDILQATWLTALWSNVVFTSLLALLFWKPLKRVQNHTEKTKGQSDFTDKVFTLTADVDEQGQTEYQYSGVNWRLKSHQPISASSQVKIIHIEVGILWVEKTSDTIR